MTDAPTDFASLIEPVARELLGEPNANLSTKTELRYGTCGSLAVNIEKGVWHDHETNEGGGTLDLVTRETGLHEKDRIDWLKDDGYLENGHAPNGQHQHPKFTIKETYDYPDENHVRLFQVCRLDPKDFRQRRPVSNG